MRLVVQRVLESSVKVDGREVGRIGKGFMVLCGVEDGDTAEDVRYCVDKTVNLRIFEDENDKMNRSILDAGGEILAISQFTSSGPPVTVLISSSIRTSSLNQSAVSPGRR